MTVISTFSRWFLLFLLGFISLFVVFMSAYKWIKDSVLSLKFTQANIIEITEQMFLDHLALYSFDIFRLRFVRKVRTESLLHPSKDVIEMFKHLVLVVERDKTLRVHEGNINPYLMLLFSFFVAFKERINCFCVISFFYLFRLLPVYLILTVVF